MYYFHYEQVFVKNFGGVMSIAVPDGQLHMQATWKDDNLWIENYDPKTNTCIFSEYSKGNLLEGRVKIKNCNPLMPKTEQQANAITIATKGTSGPFVVSGIHTLYGTGFGQQCELDSFWLKAHFSLLLPDQRLGLKEVE